MSIEQKTLIYYLIYFYSHVEDSSSLYKFIINLYIFDRDASVRADQVVIVRTKVGYRSIGKNESTGTSINPEN